MDLAEKLQRVLENRDDVRLALLFGSAVKDRDDKASDVDVGVEAEGVDLLALASHASM